MTPMPDTLTHSQTTEYRATQLVSSIKHKLSHAIFGIFGKCYLCDNRVINACGFWGREVGKLAGLDLPLVPVQHQVLLEVFILELDSSKDQS